MITVAVVGFRRPDYLSQVIESLVACEGFYEDVSHVVISIDDSLGEGSRSLHRSKSWQEKLPSSTVIAQQRRNGIVGNTILAMKAAFDSGAETVFMLEDDGLLSPDALRLVKWYEGLDDDYLAFGLGLNRTEPSDHPGHILEMNQLPCPYAYVVKRREWPFLLKNWCTKEYHPAGWSWSITYQARFLGRKFIAPKLSRVFNIGRNAGTNAGADYWDNVLSRIVKSDGVYRGEYDIVEKIDEAKAHEVSDWMINEMRQLPEQRWPSGDEWPGWLGFGCPEEIQKART